MCRAFQIHSHVINVGRGLYKLVKSAENTGLRTSVIKYNFRPIFLFCITSNLRLFRFINCKSDISIEESRARQTTRSCCASFARASLTMTAPTSSSSPITRFEPKILRWGILFYTKWGERVGESLLSLYYVLLICSLIRSFKHKHNTNNNNEHQAK